MNDNDQQKDYHVSAALQSMDFSFRRLAKRAQEWAERASLQQAGE